ncbi:MAG: hypothetical protein ACRDV1_00775 [Actinomycetes bacterium]
MTGRSGSESVAGLEVVDEASHQGMSMVAVVDGVTVDGPGDPSGGTGSGPRLSRSPVWST